MKKTIIFLCLGLQLPVHAAAMFDIFPSSTSPIGLAANGSTYLTYTLKNNTKTAVTGISIDPNQNLGPGFTASVTTNQCSGTTLGAGATCNFIVTLQAPAYSTSVRLSPKICAFNGAFCSVPIQDQRVNIEVSKQLSNTTFPTPYAGTYYPIYNSGAGQWLPPDQAPFPPFNEVSTVFVAFAHAYPQGLGAIFTFEAGQVDEPARLTLLARTARDENPNIKILMSLGWGKNDWTYINTDYVNHANVFIPSIIAFIRTYQLDGIDIDNEGINESGPDSSGFISQANFDGVIANLRNALNYASIQDKKNYYLTITPAGNNEAGGLVNTQVDAQNASSFNLINIQSYYNGDPDFGTDFYNALLSIGYPRQQIANGIDTGVSCTPDYPPYIGLAGMFNWNMTADSVCSNYANTAIIAGLVQYP
jgi:chitinase